MNPHGLVSIIVPIFNSAPFIKRCISSIQAQTYREFEVLLIDDCSEDNSFFFCKKLVGNDNRFKLLSSSKNIGPGGARNVGLNAARGYYLLFLDADDLLTDDALALLVSSQRESRSDLVVSAFEKSGPRSDTTKISHFYSDTQLSREDACPYALNYMLDPAKYLMFSYCWGRLFLSSIVNDYRIRFPQNQRICEDVHFNFSYLSHVKSIYYLDKTTYRYQFGNPYSAAMGSFARKPTQVPFFADIWTAYQNIVNFVTSFGTPSEKARAHHIARYGHISHSIVLLIRACGTPFTYSLFNLVQKMVNDMTIRENLKYYSPKRGQSKVIPFLLKLRLALPLLIACRSRYYKRYT